MKSLAPIWRLWSLYWHRHALAQLSRRDPLHADVPFLVLKVHALENAR
jgi:hypothetical protein